MKLKRFFAISASLVVVGSWVGAAKAQDKVTFEDHIKPLMKSRCASCHNPDKKSGDLDVTTYTAIMQGGGSGASIEAGDATASYLFKLVNHDEEPSMPPDADPIPEEERTLLRKWIDGGVLENSGSKAAAPKKKKFNLAMDAAPTERPAVVPVPGHLSLQPVLRTKSLNAVPSIATSPWAPLVAVAGQKQVLVYNSDSLQLVGVFPFPEGKPQVLKFSRNGSLLLCGGGRGGASGKVVVWNIKDGRRVMEIGDELDTVLAADISADHKYVALGGPQKIVRIYSTETGEKLSEMKKHTDWIYSLEFSPDGVLLASGDRNGGALVWEAATGREYLVLNGHTAAVTSISWRLDSNVLATGSEDTTIKLWELENGGQIRSWGAHGAGVASIEFTRDGRLVSNGRDRVAKMWDQAGAQQRAFEAFGDLGLAISYCDETDRVIAGDWTGEVRVWKGADGARLGNINANPETLEERLTAAERLAAEKTAQFEPANANAVAALNELTQLQQQNDSATKEKVAAETLMNESQKQVETYTANLTTTTQGYQQATELVGKLEQAVPALVEAQKQVTAALEKMNDAATKQLADSVAANLAEKQKLLETNKAEMAKLATAMEELKKQLDASTLQRDTAKQKMEQMMAKMKELEPLLVASQQKSTEMTKVATDLKAQLEAAANELNRWKSEVAFNSTLNNLIADLKAKEIALAGIEPQVAAAQAKLDTDTATQKTHEAAYAAQVKEVETATAAMNTTDGEYKTLVGQIQTRTEEMTKGQAAIDGLTKGLVSLGEAIKGAKTASELSPEDKELAAAVDMLAKLAESKTAQLKTMQDGLAAMGVEKAAWEKTAAEKLALIETQKAAVVAATAKAAEIKTLLDAAVKVVGESTVALQGVQKQQADAQAAVDAANAEIAKLQGVGA